MQKFLLLEEKETGKGYIASEECVSGYPEINTEAVSCKWSSDAPCLTLSNLTMNLKGDKIIMVVGACGSGKSSLLEMILGELPILPGGTLQVQGRLSYAAQDTWIFTGSVRQNILFGRHFEEDKYRRVVEAAALVEDFKQFSYGDKTIVGERGISLSGGQKVKMV